MADGDVEAPKQRHRVAKNHVNEINYFFLDAIWCKPSDLRHLADKKLVFKMKEVLKKRIFYPLGVANPQVCTILHLEKNN